VGYTENLEGGLFLRSDGFGFLGFCLFRFFFIVFVVFYILLHMECGTLIDQDFVLECKKPDMFLTLGKNLSVQFFLDLDVSVCVQMFWSLFQEMNYSRDLGCSCIDNNFTKIAFI